MSTHSPWRGDSFSRAADAALSGGIAGLSGRAAGAAAGCWTGMAICPACGSAAAGPVWAKAGAVPNVNATARIERFIN
jgi:hypothetical protein